MIGNPFVWPSDIEDNVRAVDAGNLLVRGEKNDFPGAAHAVVDARGIEKSAVGGKVANLYAGST